MENPELPLKSVGGSVRKKPPIDSTRFLGNLSTSISYFTIVLFRWICHSILIYSPKIGEFLGVYKEIAWIIGGLAILCDLFGMVKWPLQRLSDLQPGDKKVTNWITWGLFFPVFFLPLNLQLLGKAILMWSTNLFLGLLKHGWPLDDADARIPHGFSIVANISRRVSHALYRQRGLSDSKNGHFAESFWLFFFLQMGPQPTLPRGSMELKNDEELTLSYGVITP